MPGQIIRPKAACKCSDGMRLKPERAKRCKRPCMKATSTDAATWASAVDVSEAGAFERLAQLRFDLVEQQVDALLQALVLQHQRVAVHDAAHARVFFGELQQQRHDAHWLDWGPAGSRSVT
jgi:hypothetical protein